MERSTREMVEKIHAIVFELLCDVDDYCRENNIPYYLSGGSCLGAVRHGGFIPWDDDADIMMPRRYYEPFLRGFAEAYRDKYQIGALELSPDWQSPSARIWNRHTRLDRKTVHEPTTGVFIDAFPIDGLPEGKLARRLFHRRMMLLNILRNASIRQSFFEGERFRRVKMLLGRIMRHFPARPFAVRIDAMARKIPFETSKYVGAVMAVHYFERETIERIYMDHAVYMPFEGREFPLPNGYHQYLTNLYGDYMQVPRDAQEKGFSHLDRWEIWIDDDAL